MARKGPSGKAEKRKQAKGWSVNRRDFLKITGFGTSGALGLGVQGCEFLPIFTPDFAVTLTRPEDLVSLRFEFVNLKVQEGAGSDGGPALVAKGAGASYIVVHFAPQHIFEEALFENGSPPPPPPAKPEKPVDARIAGPSRVVLKVAAANLPIDFTGPGLLGALGKLEMNVAPNALPPPAPPLPGPIVVGPIGDVLDVRSTARTRQLLAAGRTLSESSGLDVGALPSVEVQAAQTDTRATQTAAPQNAPQTMFPQVQLPVVPEPVRPIVDLIVNKPRPRLPLNGETALELPFRLILSPNKHGGWAHNKTAEAGKKQGRYELWHTRLGVRSQAGAVSEAASYLRTVRGIWTRDRLFDPEDPQTYDDPIPAEDNVFGGSPTSLVAPDRVEIVHLSSNFRDLPSWYTPKPIEVNRLMLSTLGGWLDSLGVFGTNTPLNLISWEHKATLGRDHYVKIERAGRLYPWGHFAIKVTITERKFRGADPTTAYLWQRTFIVVREPIREYPEAWRKFPFKTVHVKTLVTPNLHQVPSDGEIKSTPIKVDASTAFRFRMEAVDREGNLVKFDAPATWVPVKNSQVESGDLTGASGAATLYDAYATQRVVKLAGQRIAYSRNSRSDDSTYETAEVLVDGTIAGSQPPMVPFPSMGIPGTGFAPGIAEATFNVEAIRHLVGKDAPTPFQYHGKYLQHGFGAGNKGEILFALKSGMSPIALNFAQKSDASGGFVAPSLDISGISRKTGPVSGSNLDDIAANKFDPKEFLKSIDAMIFGVIPLADIFAAVSDAAGGLGAAPQFVTQTVDAVTGFLEDIATLKARLKEVADKTAMSTQAIQDKIDAVAGAVNALFSATDIDDAISDAQALIEELRGLLNTFKGVVDSLPKDKILSSFKQDLKRRINSVDNVLDAVKTGLKAFATGLDMAKNLTVKLEWRAPLQKDPLGFFVPDPMTGGFLLAVEARGKKVGDKPPGVDVVAGIENFDVNVFGENAKIVTIPFERLVFKVESGRKPDVDVVFKGGVGFDGVLAFVETLSQLIPSQGFSDPPALQVSAEGIKSSFSLPIPSVAVGVFALQNLSIGAGFEVPFIGNPLSVNFNFCTREEPFVLTVMCIGGGGFFGIKLSPRGLLLLEAAFEAGAQLALDFGVASGSVSIAVGVYFRLEQVGGQQEGSLTGYLRIQGKVDVLGLISASITLLLELIYEFASGKLIGRATLTIEVSIVFFSFSVEVTCERKLAGSNGDPTFLDQMDKYDVMLPDGTTQTVDPWAEYCESFLLAA